MRRRGAGLVLVELMTVLAVAAILLAVALPDLRALLRQQRFKTAARELLGALELTRAQALARGERVELVPLEAGGSDWSLGWVVMVDRDGDRRPGAADEVIALHGPVPEGMRIDAAFSSVQRPDYIAYNSAGRGCSDRSAAAARWGTLTLEQAQEQTPTRRLIVINMLGRARLCDPGRSSASCGGAGPQ